ncbi:replication initiator protein [Sigmofec virus UA08Rod_4967]|uniref:Replication initiator protein n=1 Tax=Sigmofec virus UA08Rod_4967 TaxID=2929413 RepID=A0A976R7F4_9VIRU|nr:replication initiator protein [Sigmofec virus UA08Rod_4967]
MACYEPIPCWTIEGALTDNGKKKIFFCETTESIEAHPGFERLYVPCGQCIGCRLDYAKQWAARISKEAQAYPNNAFVTLTYNDLNLPFKEYINQNTGELITGNPLEKDAISKFIKRLRRQYEYHNWGVGIRYFGCGEYGGRTGRPHYHLALLNYDATAPDDIKLLPRQSKSGYPLFTSEYLERLWGKGFVTIGELTPQSAGYIARYMLKKQKGVKKEWYYESQGKIPELTRVSNRPGIAREWFEQNIDELIQTDTIYISQRGKEPMKLHTPAYGMKIMEELRPEDYLRVKEARKKKAEMAKQLKLSRTTLDEWQQLKVEEAQQQQRAKLLVRNYENSQ